MKVITWLVKNNASYPQAADYFNISNQGTVWQWKRQYDLYGYSIFSDHRKRVKIMADKKNLTPSEENKQLKKRLEYLEAEKCLSKKFKGRNGSNREKAEAIDSLRPDYRLSMLLEIAGMSSSSYFDARKRNYGSQYDTDDFIVEDIKSLRAENKEAESLGYRPLTIKVNTLRNSRNESPVNHKRILRIMRQMDCSAMLTRRKLLIITAMKEVKAENERIISYVG
ncbi:IS3 family transposase [Companilactobacillus metriopterae]|uniref:IS3 family transposase n=1 Tax=Companilactobacillus metriopterae TaxID=1909267 RepID=UPI00100C2787|nr:IS3 family transposase [Companilactobacillus metriopterae]